jgi:hypothetical protein
MTGISPARDWEFCVAIVGLAGPICAIAETEPVTTLENHVTVLPPPPHMNHEKKKIQETPI